MKKRIVLLGPPASGKGTQAELIMGRYNIPSASPGAMLREQKNAGTRIGIEADKLTRTGSYVADELVMDMVSTWLLSNEHAFVLDGVPRTLVQAKMLDRRLEERRQTLQIAILLDASEESIKQRVANRRVCVGCAKIYSLELNIAASNAGCPNCGDALVVRSDDNPAALETRLREYAQKSAGLVPFYREKSILARIDGNRSPAEVFADLVTVLEAT